MSELAPVTASPGCAHCGAPVTGASSFCCPGCETVYHMLRASGLDDFYRYQQLQGDNARCDVSPVATPSPAGALRASADLLRERARPLPGGLLIVDALLEGLHCAGCVWLIERLPGAVAGVREARVDLSRQRLSLAWDPADAAGQDPLERALAWLERHGYRALARDGRSAGEAAQRPLLRRMGVAWAVTGNIMLLASAQYAGLDLSADPALFHASRVASLLLSTASLLYGADIFWRRALAALGAWWRTPQRGWPRLSIDVPLSLGVWIGWVYSAWAAVVGQGEVWFDSLAMLIAVLLTARWVQARATRSAAQAAERVLALLPQLANRLNAAGEVEIVPLRQLIAGDRVEVRAGDLIPTDGIICQGRSSLHRGVLTGESRAEPVRSGELVEAGTTNLDAPLIIEVTRAAAQSQVGELQRWIEDRARRRAPLEQQVDRLGAGFVLAILALAALTAIIWGVLDPSRALDRVIAVLVVSCPCALAMATPMTLAAAIGRGARQGIFIKHDDVIEALDEAKVIVLDKTGTLTLGQLSVLSVRGDGAAVALGGALERQSNHPIARALSALAGSSRAERVEEVAGSGMRGEVDGHDVAVGAPAWIAQITGAPLALEDGPHGATPVLVAVDGQHAATVWLGDAVRPEARGVLDAWRAQARRVVLMSGDDERVVAQVGAALGFAPEERFGRATPEQKRAFVEALRADGARVVMVGDGVNDAAALEAADVGIAMQGGAGVNLVAADIFLTRPGLLPLATLTQGAAQTLRVVRRNLFASGMYNALAIALAMLGLITPLWAAILMPISSLMVVLSSWHGGSSALAQPVQTTAQTRSSVVRMEATP